MSYCEHCKTDTISVDDMWQNGAIVDTCSDCGRPYKDMPVPAPTVAPQGGWYLKRDGNSIALGTIYKAEPGVAVDPIAYWRVPDGYVFEADKYAFAERIGKSTLQIRTEELA